MVSTAEQEFRDGKCADAIAAYTIYLQANPAAPDRDLVLLRIATCRLLPQNGAYDPDEALRILNELTSRFPGSSWRPHAELILAMTAKDRERLAELELSNARVRSVSEQLEAARKAESATRAELQQLQAANTKELKERDAKIRQLTSTVEELEQRIRQLSEDLEALKKIDLQRKPSRPRP
jgi:TolA-binding protein